MCSWLTLVVYSRCYSSNYADLGCVMGILKKLNQFIIQSFKCDNTSRKALKSGIHSDGRPYLDMSDKYTANAIRDAVEKYRGIEVN